MDIYRAIFRNAPDPILLVDDFGMIVEANPEAHRALGYGDGELTGLPVDALVPAPYAASHREHREGFMRHPRMKPMGTGRELSARRKDGSEMPVEIMLSPAEGEDGLFVVAILRDRTERRMLDAQVRELQERLRLSADAAGMGYWTYDEAKDEFWCDETYADLLGGRPGDFPDADSVRNRIHPGDLEARRMGAIEAMDAEGRYESEFRIVRSNGSVFWIGELGRRIGDTSAPNRRYAGVSFDISKRKADQSIAEEARRRERNLLDLAPDGVFLADIQGVYIDVNKAGCGLLGRAREEIVGKTIVDFLHPEEFGRLAEVKEKLLRGETNTREWRLRHCDGSYVPVEVSARIFPDGRWQGFVRDIRERKAAEAKRLELIESLKASLKEIRVLRGMLPICSYCKKIRDEEGKWQPIELYIHNRSDADFSHGICPDCLQAHYSEIINS